MNLKQLLKETDITVVSGNADREITTICYDSRNATDGALFVCVVGYETDGHRFVSSAIENGATVILAQTGSEISVEIPSSVCVLECSDTRKTLAVLAAAYYGHPEQKLTVIGVTGTNGKTTVTTLIRSAYAYVGIKTGLLGTNENIIGDRVIPTQHTTPDSLELFALFAQMVQEGISHVIMEVSSHSLELYRVWGVPFAVGTFTNLTRDHLDFHKTMENYLAAKKKLFLQAEKGVVNVDDAGGAEIVADGLCPYLTYGIDQQADLVASDIRMDAVGVYFTLHYCGKTYNARLGIPGRFSVYNALAAIGTLLSLGMKIETAVEAMMIAHGVPGRCETVYTDTDYTVIIDYAHTPDGLENIIKTVREFCRGKVITLFGCGGDRDKTKRPIMGKLAADLSDFCIVTSDNPRTEEPGAIIEDILAGVRQTEGDHTVIENRKEAIFYALSHAAADDCIILAGKGHETYQIIGKEKLHFDEREVIAEYFKR